MSIKQDGTRVRTAYDLEQKYKLAEMRRAFEQSENSITRVNKILQDFVNTVVGTLDSFEGLSDGFITTYFYSGTPSLDGTPSTGWEDGYENHLNDLYYDKETGKAYQFMVEDGVYSWVEVTDEKKINVMAMANATVDTKDHIRRLFVEQPNPPYDNGDLWLKDGVIYSCQISKPGTETYDVHDFILSSEYDGDTLAIKVGNQLEVLKGTVLKVIEDAEFMRVEIDDLDREEKASIELMKNMLATLIKDENGQSMMTQTEDGWSFEMKSILETMTNTSEKLEAVEGTAKDTADALGSVGDVVKRLEEKTAYIHMGQTEDGKPRIELGAEGSGFKVVITNTEILFLEGTHTPASISNETMNIKNANVENTLQIGSLVWVKRANGHISLMPKGV